MDYYDVADILENHLEAPIDDRLRAMLTYLQKVTLHPGEVTVEDARAVREHVSDQAIEDALHVALCFNAMDRFADAFDFELESEDETASSSSFLFNMGYTRASIPG